MYEAGSQRGFIGEPHITRVWVHLGYLTLIIARFLEISEKLGVFLSNRFAVFFSGLRN